MKALRARLILVNNDQGMSLIEVVVAIVILGTLTATSLGVFLSTLGASTNQQRRQVAITVASETMESVTAWNVAKNSTTGVSNLYTGRSKTAVQSQWTANSSVGGVPQTYATWDPTATGSSVPGLPLTRTVSRSNTTYTATTFIGTCYQPLAGGDCVKLTGQPLAPVITPSGYSQLTRIIVVVSWTAGEYCASGGCTYATATLVDTNTDLEWNVHP